VVHVARMGKIKTAYKMLFGKLNRRDYTENLGIDDRMILESIVGKYGENLWTGFIWLRISTSGG